MKNLPLLTIDLGALGDNYSRIKGLISLDCEAAGVVKANAYGLGMERVAPALARAGCRKFFVALPQEGEALRALAKEAEIFIFGGFQRGAEDLYARHDLIPVLNSEEETGRYRKAGGGKCALHFDTGINRLGLETLPDDLQGLNVQMILSHFACADEDHPKNEEQYEKFLRIAALFPNVPKSLANSSGVFRDSKYHFNLVRPGMSLYGLNPTPGKPNPMRRVVTLDTPVLQTRTAKRGETAGYGATYGFERDTQLAVCALGYADGIHRALSNKGALYYKGQALPMRGRISMDFIAVEIGHLPENSRPTPGERLEVIGEYQSADDLAAAAGTIGYEILTSLGQRYLRQYS